jgi:hypothetical protein
MKLRTGTGSGSAGSVGRGCCPPRAEVVPWHGACSAARSSYSESHHVWDVDGWITMAEAGRRGAAEYGKLSLEQCIQLARIMRA